MNDYFPSGVFHLHFISLHVCVMSSHFPIHKSEHILAHSFINYNNSLPGEWAHLTWTLSATLTCPRWKHKHPQHVTAGTDDAMTRTHWCLHRRPPCRLHSPCSDVSAIVLCWLAERRQTLQIVRCVRTGTKACTRSNSGLVVVFTNRHRSYFSVLLFCLLNNIDS